MRHSGPVPVPEVTVVIPAYNASSTLPACLRALAAQVGPHPAFEVIVVDDGSSDGTAAMARSTGATVIPQAHVGAGSARNRGLAVARGDVVLFTDADCEPSPDWVQQMCLRMEDCAVAGARGVYRTRQTSLVARFVQIEYEDKYRPLAPGQSVDFVDTYSAAYRREVLLTAGGFDPRIRYVEDQELSFRLAGDGARLVFAPQAAVFHRHASSLLAFAGKKYHIAHWKVVVTLRHPSKLMRDTHTPLSQRLQHALMLLLAPAVLVGCFEPAGWVATAGIALACLATTLPFAARAARRDRAVAAAAPLLVTVRATAQALGWVTGLARFLPQRSRWREFRSAF